MNYYEHHLGDYLRDTAHLSMLEDGAYRRLIDAYYIREAPLPPTTREVFRLVRAQSKQDREAVETVLREFFTETPDGWVHSRCDREIERYHAKAPDREAKRENDCERQRRARERRKTLFESLRSHGVVADFNATTSELEALLSRATSRDVTQPVTRDNTATHTPDTSHQSPDPVNTHTLSSTAAGSVCVAMRREGLSGVNPGHPDLLALLQAGASEAEFIGAARESVARNKGFAYAMGMLKRQRQDAAQAAQGMATGAMPPPGQGTGNTGPEWARQRDAAVAAYAGPFAAKPAQQSLQHPTEEVVDVSARRVG